MLTRKDYEAIAQVISGNRCEIVDSEQDPQGFALHGVAGELADYMASDNPNFDRSRFLKACGFLQF